MNILLICYNRPEYTSKVLESLKYINNVDKLFISIDAYNEDDFVDKSLVEKTLEIINEFKFENKHISVNQVKLGCKKHVKYALKWAISELSDNDLLFVLEDDIVLLEGLTQERLKTVKKYKNKYFVLKFNKFFWGWVSNKKTIEILLSGLTKYIEEYDSIKTDIMKLVEFKNKYKFKDINYTILELEPHSKNIYVPWDEEFPTIMFFNKILDIKCENGEKYVENIGIISSRNPQLEPTYNNSNNLRFYIDNGNIVYY